MTANHYLDVGNRLANDEVNVYWGGIFTVTERFYLFDEPSTYVERGEDIARAIANVTVHELGHALGLVPEPFPDAHFGHNYEYTGSWITVPPFSGLTPLRSPERKVMNAGSQYKAGARRAYHLTETVLDWQLGQKVRRPVRVPMQFNLPNRQYLETILPR